MLVDRFASCKNIVPGFRVPRKFSPPPPPPKWSLNPLEETLPQPVLKSFITVFIQYKGIENKLTRTQLLGLAKSVYYETTLSAKGPSWVRIDW